MKFFRTFLAALLAVVVGSFMMGFLWILALVGIAGSMESTTAVQPESVLVINLDEVISDSPVTNPFNNIDFNTMSTVRHMSLYSALRAIDAAAGDSRIKGIYLRLNGQGSADITTLEELRETIAQFKESGKFVVAYNETYGQFGYYLASVADRVYLQPEGMILWNGITFNVAFYKGLLDKLDIEPEVFRPTACKYKSAVEPYILTKMSDANRRQMTELAESIWGSVTAAVSESRSIPVAKLNELADNLSAMFPEEALANGLVDGLVYEDQMNDVFAEYGVEAGRDGEYNMVTLGEYAMAGRCRPEQRLGRPCGHSLRRRTDRRRQRRIRCHLRQHHGRAHQVRTPRRQGQGRRSARQFAGRQRTCERRHLARTRTAQGRETGHRVDGRIRRQRRLLHIGPGRRDHRRQDDPYGFHRSLRHVHERRQGPQGQAGHHVRRRKDQHVVRLRQRHSPDDGSRAGQRSCAA